MSKLKLMYDVINTMKDKEVINGALKVEGKKDETQVVSFVNEFEKNLVNGETKVKISTELDYDGKKVKHESNTEFTMMGCHGKMHHGMMKHMHYHNHHGHHCGENQDDPRCGGIKGKLTKLAFVLNVFNQIKVEENEDKSVILSLSLDDIPDEMKKVFQERCSQRTTSEHQHPHGSSEGKHHHALMKEFCTLKDPKIEFRVLINKIREVEKILVTVDGKQINELNENHDLSLKAELNLA